MDRRTVLAIVLMAAIWYGWLALRGPQLAPEETAEAEVAETKEPAEVETPAVANAPEEIEPAEQLTEAMADFEFCGAVGKFSTERGLHGVTLTEHEGPYLVQPLYSWVWGRLTGSVQGGWHPWGAAPPGSAEILSTEARALIAGAGAAPSTVFAKKFGSTSGTLELEGRNGDGIAVTQRLEAAERGSQCVVEMEVTWTNRSAREYDGALWVASHESAVSGAGGVSARYSSMRQPTAAVDGDLNYGGPTGAGCVTAGTRLEDEVESREFELAGPVSWLGLSDRYFGIYLIPEAPDHGTAWLSRIGEGEQALDGVHWVLNESLAAGASHTETFTVYMGANDMAALDEVHDDLSWVVDLGWFAFFGYPLLWMLRLFYSAVGNWGMAIVMVTFAIKVVFFPMTQRSFRSMQKTQQIQPELNRIREEYADKPQEMNRKMFELMQKHDVNPASGCLPMLVQFPVWIALYNVLLTSVDLYHTEFLYLKDLTQPDPYLILPTIIMGLMFLQQQFTTPNANMDPAQRQLMRLMPLFFGLLFFAFPSGLAVYVFVNMVLSILQQWLIKRSLDNEGPATPAAAAASS